MPKNSLSPREEDKVRPNEIINVIKKEAKDDGLKNIPVVPGNYKKFKGNNKSLLPKGIIWGVVGLIVLFIVGTIISFTIFRAKLKDSIATNVNNLEAGVSDLENFDTSAAASEFSSLGTISSTFGNLFGGGNALASFADFSKQLVALTTELNNLKSSSVAFIAGSNDSGFASDMTGLQGTVDALQTDSGKLAGLSTMGNGGPYLALASEIGGAKQFLDTFVPWLTSSTPHHVLVLFDNTSELRPGGGFIGSYADVTIASGTIANIAVHDVNDVDNTFAPNIIPPTPLQAEIKAFRPADTNWFFDYPTSASKTIEYFEESSLYASSTTFDDAIAVTPQVVSDLLSLTGPISVGKPTTTFTSSNLSIQIQKIVEAGQATDATYPKQILSELANAIFSQIQAASSTSDLGGQLLTMALNWIQDKDVMIYASDPTIENFVNIHGASGAMYGLGEQFNGDYLAIADADIFDGKSEFDVSSTVTLTDNINTDGTMTSHLVVDRADLANASSYSWYRTTNQDYMQIYLPLGATLTNETGGSAKTIAPLTNYSEHGYVNDPLISAIQSTDQSFFNFPAITLHQEDGKEVFSTWSTVAPGATAEVTFDYSHRLFLSPANGVQYQFVFEKQPGSSRSYNFTINAPLGYVFAENNLPAFEYQSSDPPGQLVITLTLQQLPQ